MDEAQILEALLELAGEAELTVRTGRGARLAEDLPPMASGVCRVGGQWWVVLSASDSLQVHVETLAAALREHAPDLIEERHLAPAVRRTLDPMGD
jgi:hypothetical protein